MSPHFNLLSRLFRSDSSSTRSAEAPARAAPGFPGDMSKADRSAWWAQAASAIEITRRLDAHSTQAGLAAMEVRPPRCAAAAPQLPVNPATLLDPALVMPDKLVRQLHANQLQNGHLLMSTPGTSEAFAWADICDQHDVKMVLDLGESRSAGAACMQARKPFISHSNWQVRFDPHAQGPGRFREHKLRDIGAQATQCEMSIQRSYEGKGIGHPQTLSWIRVPVDDRHEMSPRLLLDTCRHLQAEWSAEGRKGKIAFQCPQGDHRGAVFAAAHQLFERFQSGGLRPGGLADAVFEECAKVRSDRSHALFTQGHVTSLMAFCGLLMEERRSASRRVATPSPVAPSSLDPSHRAPLRSALRGTEAGDPTVPTAQKAQKAQKAPPRRVAFDTVAQVSDGTTVPTKPGRDVGA